MYLLTDYDYHLPGSLIAMQPAAQRDQSRLLCLDRRSGDWEHRCFADLADLLDPGDLLVVNNTRVIKGRLLGRKQSGGKVEVLVLDYAQGMARNRFECMVRASKRPKPGSRLFFEQGLVAHVEAVNGDRCAISFSGPLCLDQALEAIGHVPLPPYIRREERSRDRETYQTVYAANRGAIAAPTAGLHFTHGLLERIKQKGIGIVCLTLHVGYGTFAPVRAADIRTHQMHSEWFSLEAEVADAVTEAKSSGKRVVAVGTTSVRTLEYCALADGAVKPASGMCDLFIYPGYEFKVVDAMITNFHLPQSTLLMLVSAFAGREKILDAYAEAVREKYRFFSYGDAMFINTSV
jgi:S-adenosylmethionine:tRNA ribosyltransferase-isomerase